MSLFLQLKIKISPSRLNLHTRAYLHFLSKLYQSSKLRLSIFYVKFSVLETYLCVSPGHRNIRYPNFRLMASPQLQRYVLVRINDMKISLSDLVSSLESFSDTFKYQIVSLGLFKRNHVHLSPAF